VKVALTNPYAWPEVRRGSETVVRGLGRWLAGQGHDITLMAGGSATSRYDLDGVPVETFRSPDLRGWYRDLDPAVTFVPAMARRLRREQPAAVHSFLYQDGLAARLAGRPYLVSYGGIALRRSFDGHALWWRMFRAASAGARALVCPSRAAADHLAVAFGYRAHVIPNGLWTSDFAVPTERDPALIFCAAAPDDTRKRVDVLVAAFAKLVADAGRPPAGLRLALAGPASSERRRQLLSGLGEEVADAVTFLGDLDAPALATWYATATVTCLPSLNEAFGMVVVESMAAGTPVVGADHGALPELINDAVGATFPPDDVDACAAALSRVLRENADGGMGDACRERAAECDWSTVGPQFVELYGHIAS